MQYLQGYISVQLAPFAKTHWRAYCGYAASLLIDWRSAHQEQAGLILMQA